MNRAMDSVIDYDERRFSLRDLGVTPEVLNKARPLARGAVAGNQPTTVFQLTRKVEIGIAPVSKYPAAVNEVTPQGSAMIFLLDRGVSAVSQRLETALFVGSMGRIRQEIGMVQNPDQLMLEHRVVGGESNGKYPLLHYIVLFSRPEILKMVLESFKLRLDQTIISNGDTMTPQQLAESLNKPEMAQVFVEYCDGRGFQV